MNLGINARTATVAATDSASAGSEDAVVSAIDAAARLVLATTGEFRGPSLSAAVLSARLAEVAAALEARMAVDVMPLAHELHITTEWLASNGAGRDVQAAVSMGLDTLLARLRGVARNNWDAIQFAAIVNLRSVRKEALLFSVLPMIGDGDTEPRGNVSSETAARLLPEFRTGLLNLLKERFVLATTRLARACRSLDAETGVETRSRHWRQAAEIFDGFFRSEAADLRVAVTRVATRLEFILRRISAGKSLVNAGEQAQIWKDVEVLHALIIRIGGMVTPSQLAGPAFAGIGADDAKLVINAIKAGAEPADGLRALCDVFLRAGRYENWYEIWKLARSDVDREGVLRRLAAWNVTSQSPGETEPTATVHTPLAQAEAALERLGEKQADAGPAPESAQSGATTIKVSPAETGSPMVPVDEALLENLKLAATGIRGARSRAEANLGSMRGGLQDMERTIKALRTQLEVLELDPGNVNEVKTPPKAQQDDGVPPRLSALSSGIDELKRLQDALNALTEETEMVLASQANEDSELEQGLLKTRLVPLSTQFAHWNEALIDVVAVKLDIHGGGAMLERRAAAALSNALIPLLKVCAAEVSTGQISIDVSRPKIDLLLQIHFAGGPIAPESWSVFRAALEKLGAFAVQDREAPATTFRIVVPGPPESLDVLVVELGGQRFALPVDGVAGVVRRSPWAATEEDGDAVSDAESLSLAVQLGIPEASVRPGCGQANHLLLGGESLQRVACRVDAIHGRERVLARSPGALLANNPWILAVVLNQDAPPMLVLDLRALVPALIANVAAI